MGALANEDVSLVSKYARLGVRFETLLDFYHCVRAQVNDHKSPEVCVDGGD